VAFHEKGVAPGFAAVIVMTCDAVERAFRLSVTVRVAL
jgi:hypothetical protein